MKARYYLCLVGFLAVLNFFAWKEVFVLAENNNLKVVFFDVGQGDSAFIETPEGHQIVIDGGPNSALLQKLGGKMPFWDKTIDLVILTHPEKDHMTGLLDLLQRYKIDYFLWTGVVKNNAENKKLAQTLDKIQKPSPVNFFAELYGFLPYGKKPYTTKIVIANAGQKIKTGSSIIYLLHPVESLYGKEVKNTNDSSVVIKLVYGKSAFIFTGDIGFSVEKKLVLADIDLSADVLKVAHHGSKYSTSEEFLAVAGPEIAVISSGKNSYGHPTPDTLQRLDDFGVKTLRTDQIGDITILSDGQNIQIQ